METLNENVEKIDDIEVIDDINNDDILDEKKENNIFDTVIDVTDEEPLVNETHEEMEVINPENK